MVGHSTDLPPWEPIADWLARLPNVSCDEEHEDTREPSTASRAELRDRYEKTAKAIAYDITVATHDTAEQIEQDMKRQAPKPRGDLPSDGVLSE